MPYKSGARRVERVDCHPCPRCLGGAIQRVGEQKPTEPCSNGGCSPAGNSTVIACLDDDCHDTCFPHEVTRRVPIKYRRGDAARHQVLADEAKGDSERARMR